MGWKINKIQRRLLGLIFVLNLNNFVSAESINQNINNHKDQFEKVAMDLWDFAELGYQENQSSSRLINELEKEGFAILRGVADIPTAFIAEYSNGGPVIGILGEFDALPGLAQTSSPFKEIQSNATGAGQACGHHLFGAGSA